ncbi:hypothetical protein AU210_016314 [Fusarium oxysporum f. sp. radicis-cucumerinum]|uniref:DUF6606 domain-containing protein n=1 Tax=Fusarium oxysporum f. sp. radicis-cucumerinum TaxID=327505 RepID=A0A2H3G072_FUSOX|nr:hypothetical protein AU210_016314 [Fusarium oxysporum f. sp. radicis-cucumerinum]
MATEESALVEALFHHLVLPPRLPRSFDEENVTLAQKTGERLQNALAMFHETGDTNVWRTLKASLQATADLNQGPFYQDDLLKAFKNMQDSSGTVWLGVHVEPQNAALIVSVIWFHLEIFSWNQYGSLQVVA